MADDRITSYIFPTTWRYYDSERRERYSPLSYYARIDGEYEAGHYIWFDNVSINTFTIDWTDQENWTTVGEYANGIKFQVKNNGVIDESLTEYSFYYGVRLLKPDGTIFKSGYVSAAHIDKLENRDLTAVTTYVCPTSTYYYEPNGNLSGEPASRVSVGFTCYTEKWKQTGGHWPPIGGRMSEDDLADWYNSFGTTAVWGSAYTDAQWADLLAELENAGNGTPITPKLPSEDTSEPGGGDPESDYNPYSDPIDFPGLPTGGDSISTGFVRVYTPTAAELHNLAAKLWSNDFFNTIQKIMNDPMEAVISLHSVPYALSGTDSICMVGNYDTDIHMPAVTQQWYTINLGSIYIPEHWASALDYSPYVTVDCFIPFVGVVSFQVDDIIGKVLNIQMNTDVISGATLVSVMCGNSVMYTYNTNVIYRHAMTQSSFGPLYQSILGMVGAAASGAAMGGAGGALGGMIGGALNTALTKHGTVNRGGSIGGATGVLGHFVPYLIIHRPLQSLASGFRHFKGYPSNITATLSSLSGYTEVESIHLTGISCTDQERDEIMALLYNGVIL